jgi:hypothetical protein
MRPHALVVLLIVSSVIAGFSVASTEPPSSERGPDVKNVDQLIADLKVKYWPDRYRAAVALGTLGPAASSAVPALIDALSDQEALVRSAAAQTLGNIGAGAQAAIQDLIRALKDKQPLVRAAAAEALGKIEQGGSRALPSLLAALKDPELSVRLGAETALAKRPRHADHAQAPTLVVRIKSISDLISDAKYLGTVAGQEDQVGQAVALVTSLIGLARIDAKRPLGFYGTLRDDLLSGGVALVPVADEQGFLSAFEEYFVAKAKRGDDGVYTLTSQTAGLHTLLGRLVVYDFKRDERFFLRFANKYAYVTAKDKAALVKGELPDPEMVLSGVRTATVSTRFHIDQSANAAKGAEPRNVELPIANRQEKKVTGETQAQSSLWEQMLRSLSDCAAAVLKEGREVEACFDVDRKAGQLVFEVSVAGKPGSSLAEGFIELGQSQSMFGGILSSNAAVNMLVHVVLPEAIRKLLEQAIHEGLHKGLDTQRDEVQREKAKKLFHALEPTVKAGELNFAATLRGPNEAKHYALLVGIKVKDGTATESALQDLLQVVPEHNRLKIKLNAETIGNVKVHRIEARKDFDDQARRILGDNPLFLAIRSDAIVLTGGEGGFEALKGAMALELKSAPQVQVEFSVARLAPLMAKGAEAFEEIQRAAAACFQGHEGSDKVRFTLEGGKTLKARLTIDASVVTFASQVSQNPAVRNLNAPVKNAAKKSNGLSGSNRP